MKIIEKTKEFEREITELKEKNKGYLEELARKEEICANLTKMKSSGEELVEKTRRNLQEINEKYEKLKTLHEENIRQMTNKELKFEIKH